MSPEQSSDWLPSGWTSRSKSNDYGKKIKFYVDPATGRKFYSKAQVVKYLEEAKSETFPELAINSVDNVVNKENESKANESLDWLPDGWTVEERNRISGNSAGSKFKFYVDPATGRKFYSKAQVVKYLEEAKSETIPELAITSVDNVVNKANESLDWLPDGWIVEERTRNSGTSAGSKFKVYTDPKSGQKFYSKPEVSRYLAKISGGSTPLLGINAVNRVSSTVEEPKETNKETKQTNEELKQTIEEAKQAKESPEWLPQGWSVESKTGECGKKRKVYIDPASGNKFYSKPQVSRYLEKINSSLQIVSGSNSSQQIVTGSANDQCLDQTGSGPSFKPEVSSNHQTNKSKFDEKKLDGGDDLIDNGTFERVTDEKFPPGWVKEIRMRKTGDKHKDQFYIDPVSGYMFRSKVDALRYVETGDIRFCKCRPKKRDISDLNLMIENTPHDIDQSTGGMSFSKPEVSEDHKTNQSDISGDPSALTVSRSNDVVGKNSSEEIPPGWKIEYKTRKMANRVVKDPYYLDPVTGYEFRSKPDVMRYLETGDINSCKIKPKKRDVNDLMSGDNISPSSAVEVKKSGTTTKRQYPGEIMDNTVVSKSAVSPEVGRSQNRRRNESVATMDLSSPVGHTLEASPGKISEPINKDSKGEVINLSSANDIILSVINDIFNDDEVLESEHSIEETRSSTKSKKKRVLNPPLRSSKRLAGVNLDQPVKSCLGESSQAVAGNGEEIEANYLSNISASPCKVPQQLQTPTNGKAADSTSIWKDNILSNELNGSGIKLVEQSGTENQSGKQVTEKLGDKGPQKELAQNAFTGDEITSTVYQMDKGKGQQGDALESNLKRLEVEKQNDSRNVSEQPPIEYPYMEDPCFEFAFKTLTGAIPVEENLSFQDYFKEQDTSQNECGQVTQPSETVQPNSFSTIDVASHSAAFETPAPLQQWPPNSTTYPASENISLPSFTNTGQQFGVGAGWQTKAK